MACDIAHQISRLRAQAVAMATKHVETLHPGSHALLNCGPVRVISPIAVAVDVSGTLVADVSLEPRKPVTGSNAKTKPPGPSIPGCFSSGDVGCRGGLDSVQAQPAPKNPRARYTPLAAAHTLKEMEHVLQETNPRQSNFTVPDKSTGKRVYHTLPYLQPADKRQRVNDMRRHGRWYIGEGTLPCATYVFVLCLCDSQVDDVLAGRAAGRAFEWDLASRRRPFDGQRRLEDPRRPKQDDEFLFCKKDSYVLFAVSPAKLKVTRSPGPRHVII